MLLSHLKRYAILMRLHRPIGIYLLLWPALIALWLASGGAPSLRLVVIFTLGVLVMRSAGCVINDYADRNMDGHVARTKERPLITGIVSNQEAMVLFVVLLLISLFLVLLTNLQTILLAPIAALLAVIYPFTKRYIQLPQLVLGVSFAFAIPMVFTASNHPLNSACWLLFLATVFFALAYDTEYAMVDIEDDKKIGIKSSAILFGEYDKLWILTFHMLMLSCLLMLGVLQGRGELYYLGLLIALSFVLYQQWLIRSREPTMCFKAFLNNHWIGLILFVATVLDFAVTS